MMCKCRCKCKYNVQRHEHVHNKNSTQNNIAPTTISVDSNVNNLLNQTQSGFGSVVTSPTTMYVGDNDPPTTINAHSNTVPIEDYNNVLGIAHEWKKECDIKDNGIHARNKFLSANNCKLQDEFVKNKILNEQNQNIMEKNNQLELEKEALIEDGDNKVREGVINISRG